MGERGPSGRHPVFCLERKSNLMQDSLNDTSSGTRNPANAERRSSTMYSSIVTMFRLGFDWETQEFNERADCLAARIYSPLERGWDV